MKILTVDIGGNNVKILLQGETKKRKFPSGPQLTPQQMIAGIKKITADWKYDHVSIGFPGPVKNNKPVREPVNLGTGWVDFDYEKSFGCPVRMINDAAMQATGSYAGGDMLFLGLGTGLGTVLIFSDCIIPMELGHLPYKKERSFEDYLGTVGLERLGINKWKKHLLAIIQILSDAFGPEYVVLGGGNAKKLSAEELPENVNLGDNMNAFTGGFRLWETTEQEQINQQI